MDSGQFDVDLGVIYTYEDDYMRPLLSSLAESGRDLRMRLLLVDNVSASGADQWRSLFPRVDVLRNNSRLQYAANLNRILAAATAPYVMLLNTDMFFEPREQTVARLARFMDRHPECGLAACRLYHPAGTYGHPARRFPTLKSIAARRLGLARILRKTARDHLYQEREPAETFACDWVSGCLMFVRRQAAEQVGPLDEGYGKYFEDVDYCLRMRRAGWQVMFTGQTFAWHWEQRASKRLWSRDAWRHLQAYARFLRKWGLSPGKAPRLSRRQEASNVAPPGPSGESASSDRAA